MVERIRKYGFAILLLVVALSVLVMNIPRVAATTDTIGGTSNQDGFGNAIFLFPITASASGSLSSIGINAGSTGGESLVLGIYGTMTNLGGGGGYTFSNLLGQSASTAVASGWNDLSVTGVTITASSTYYLAAMASATDFNLNSYDNNPSGLGYQVDYGAYPTFPATTSHSGCCNDLPFTANMRITYGAAATSTTTTTTGTSVVSTTVFSTRTTTGTATGTSAPDLTVDSVWLEENSAPGQPVQQVAPGDQFLIVASIKDIGTALATGYYLDVYYDSDFGRGGPDTIAPGETQVWYVGPLTAVAGAHTIKWIVDPDNQIVELNESNNEKDYTFTIGSQTNSTTVLTTQTTTTTSTSTSSITTQTSTTTASSSSTMTTSSQDKTPPVVTVPADMTVNATGPSGAVVTFTVSAVDSVDGSLTPTCAPSSGSMFALGSTQVACSVKDKAGNTASASFKVTVVDKTPPTIVVPADMTVPATSASGAVVKFTVSASDLVDGSVTVTCTPASGSTFRVGTTTVSCSAKDKAGNAASGSFKVTVTVVIVTLLNSNGNGLSGAVVQYYSGGWKPFGTTSSGGTVSMALPPGTYIFQITYAGASLQKSQNVGTNSNVVFQTVKVHSDSGKCVKYIQVETGPSRYPGSGWQTFTQDMELLPGTYMFRFSDNTKDTSYTLVVGALKHIH